MNATRLCISVAAQETPERVGLVVGDQSFTFGALWQLVAPLIERLPACPVALTAHPQLEEVLVFYACLEKQRTVLLLHPRFSAHERQRVLDQFKNVAVYQSNNFEFVTTTGAIEPLSDDQILVATSGTTGEPKLVPLSQDNLIAAAEAHNLNLPFEEGDRWLLSLPFSHIGGASILIRCLWARSTVVILPHEKDEALWRAQLEKFKISLLSVVPTQLQRLVTGHPVSPHLRAVLVGGAPASPQLRALATQAGLKVIYSYGMTEASSQVCTQSLKSAPLEPSDSVGRPLFGVEVRVNADGRIEVRGKTIFRGYWGTIGQRTNDDWFVTSDCGEIRSDGTVAISGRSDNVIITGGENVSPEGIERGLLETGVLRDVCVVGIPDSIWGQAVVAMVVPSVPGDEWETVCRKFSLEYFASYARPKHYVQVDSLATLPSGKPDRARLLSLAEAYLTTVAGMSSSDALRHKRS